MLTENLSQVLLLLADIKQISKEEAEQILYHQILARR